MTSEDYQQLIEFLSVRFDAFDRRFEAIDRRFDAIDRRFDAIEARLTRVEVLHGDQGHRIELLAEGLTSFREEVACRFDLVDLRFTEIDRRFDQIGLRFAGIDRRLDQVEGR